jgi:hypothetical protein
MALEVEPGVGRADGTEEGDCGWEEGMQEH